MEADVSDALLLIHQTPTVEGRNCLLKNIEKQWRLDGKRKQIADVRSACRLFVPYEFNRHLQQTKGIPFLMNGMCTAVNGRFWRMLDGWLLDRVPSFLVLADHLYPITGGHALEACRVCIWDDLIFVGDKKDAYACLCRASVLCPTLTLRK